MAVFSLVHGGQQGAWCFEPLQAELEQLRHRSVAVDLPIGDPDAGASEYAEVVVSSLADVDEEVVVVGHSLGGLTLPLIAQRRPVRLLVFVCAVIPEPGTNPYDLIAQDAEDSETAHPSLLDDDAQWHLTPREEAREVFFFDCPREIQEWALDRQRPQCEKPHREVTPLREWPPVPAAVANGVFDRCIPIARARRTALRVFGRTPVELQEGHFPFLTSPRLIAEELDRLARGAERSWPVTVALEAQHA
ncbi:MAG TPA: alpha/beta hydrolase [Gaiellaceae bacterium]|nr:alpha/beta hydrolase [Gaiellaceae bacterium]